MKKVFCLVVFVVVAATGFAQDEEVKKGGFKQENIFIGGGLGLGLGGWNGGFNVGANPEIGYSITKWLDAGISTNINYFSFRAEVNNGVRQRSFNYGGGIFARIYPVGGFFIQALPEFNFITTNLKDESFGGTQETRKIKQQAPSLLLGIGYGSRNVGNSNFFTVLMFDAGNNASSPYIDSYKSKLPVLRTGFNFYFKPRRQK